MFSYRWALAGLEVVTGRKLQTVDLLGGGKRPSHLRDMKKVEMFKRGADSETIWI